MVPHQKVIKMKVTIISNDGSSFAYSNTLNPGGDGFYPQNAMDT